MKERRIVIVIAIIIAVTRLLAVSHSLFDWDEALFSLGVRDYDVPAHQPHPPGYPLFLLAAKIVALTGLDAFRCLQVVVVLAAMFVFPALYWLAREIGFEFRTAVLGATVYAFLPNVWLYGGTGFSDVPATVIVFVACALLLRGRRDARAYVAGAIVLGIAAGIRPANLLIGAVPALLATWEHARAKSYRAIAAALFAGAAIVIGSYAGAALASRSVHDYFEAVQVQSQYVRDVDSWRNPGRAPWYEAGERFLLWPFGQRDVLNAIAIGALLSIVAALVRRRIVPLFTLAVFGPIAVFSWFTLDIATPARYAIAFMAAHALLAADGFLLLGRKVQLALCLAIVAVFIGWTWPALQAQRTIDAPPFAALQWARDHVAPSEPLWVWAGLGPHADYVLGKRERQFFEEPEDIPPGSKGWVVDWRLHDGGRSFARPAPNLQKVLRRRNFEASVTRAELLVRYGAGWYPSESEGAGTYRWMRKEGVVLLPAMPTNGTLVLRGRVHRRMPVRPAFEIRWNGAVVDRFVAEGEFLEKTWTLPSRADGGSNELRISTSVTVVPAQVGNSIDTRDLGFRLDHLSWTPR